MNVRDRVININACISVWNTVKYIASIPATPHLRNATEYNNSITIIPPKILPNIRQDSDTGIANVVAILTGVKNATGSAKAFSLFIIPFS